jgi:hypothetical protein
MSLGLEPPAASVVCLNWGRNGFDGITGLKMRAEDHGLAKKMELKLTADHELALAA